MTTPHSGIRQNRTSATHAIARIERRNQMKNIKEAMSNGEVIMGVCCDISDPSVVEILGATGWDYVIINCEGGTVSPFGAELENMIRAAYLADVTPVVKVPENNPAMIASAIKLGAKIVEVPKINTKEDAVAALTALKYPPQGSRMTCWGIPATNYGAIPWTEHVQKANEELTIFAVLEEQEAMDNMEDILSVEGLEIVLIGWLDLALRLGGVNDPKVEAKLKEYQQRLLTLCKKSGISVIQGASDAASAKEAISMGARGFLFGQDDMTMLRNASLSWVTELRKAVTAATA
jgi:4-hydroxy-2-oxoheptanedioate aldolase